MRTGTGQRWNGLGQEGPGPVRYQTGSRVTFKDNGDTGTVEMATRLPSGRVSLTVKLDNGEVVRCGGSDVTKAR